MSLPFKWLSGAKETNPKVNLPLHSTFLLQMAALKWSQLGNKAFAVATERFWTGAGLLHCLTPLPRPPGPNGFIHKSSLPPPHSSFLQENDPRLAPNRGGPLDIAITFGNCSAGPTTSKMVGLFSVASALPSCFPKKLGIWAPRAGAGVPLTSFPLPSLEPWHLALGKKLDRKCHSICNITASSPRRRR